MARKPRVVHEMPCAPLTTSFLDIAQHPTDNRLLAAGWRKEGLASHDDEQKQALQPHLGVADGDFGAGGDTTRYVATLPAGRDLSGPTVSAKVYHQSVPPGMPLR